MSKDVELVTILKSKVLGALHLQESTHVFGKEEVPYFTYETNLKSDEGRHLSVCLNPDLEWPYPKNTERIIRDLLSQSENHYRQLLSIGTKGVFELQKKNVQALGQWAGYDSWKSNREEILKGWSLRKAVFFCDGFRLIYFGHPVYYLDLLLEFDTNWKPTDVQFDG